LHSKRRSFDLMQDEVKYRTSLVSKSLPIKKRIFAIYSNSAIKAIQYALHNVIYRMHKPRTGVYIFVIEGEINVAGENLSRRDGIGIWDIESVTIEATSETQILAIEVAM